MQALFVPQISDGWRSSLRHSGTPRCRMASSVELDCRLTPYSRTDPSWRCHGHDPYATGCRRSALDRRAKSYATGSLFGCRRHDARPSRSRWPDSCGRISRVIRSTVHRRDYYPQAAARKGGSSTSSAAEASSSGPDASQRPSPPIQPAQISALRAGAQADYIVTGNKRISRTRSMARRAEA